MYDAYRAWERIDPTYEMRGQFARIYVLDIGRRWGKTTKRFVVRLEDCLRNPGRMYRIASAFQKNIDEIINDVAPYVLDTAPDDIRPTYGTRKGIGTGYFFPNGSVLRLVGLDKNPDGLRGRASDGDDIVEAAFVRHLVPSIKNVLYAQYQGRPWARMCTESSAPTQTESDYDTVIVEDAKARDAYAFATIDDNPRLSPEEREEFIRAAGGREHPDCQREYFNARVRDPQSTVVPEFSADKHVRDVVVPRYAMAFTFSDPGTRDLFGLVWAYYDWARQKLVVQRSWAERNAGTSRVAAVTSEIEQELWGTCDMRPRDESNAHATLTYWDGAKLMTNPYLRVSDIDLTFMTDAALDHGLTFIPADKSKVKDKEAGSANRPGEANLYLLRQAFGNDSIEIVPNSGPLQAQLEGGRWNEMRSDFERTPRLGHLDCVKALAYGWRKVMHVRNTNPCKPELPDATHGIFMPPAKVGAKHANAVKAFGKTRQWR